MELLTVFPLWYLFLSSCVWFHFLYVVKMLIQYYMERQCLLKCIRWILMHASKYIMMFSWPCNICSVNSFMFCRHACLCMSACMHTFRLYMTIVLVNISIFWLLLVEFACLYYFGFWLFMQYILVLCLKTILLGRKQKSCFMMDWKVN